MRIQRKGEDAHHQAFLRFRRVPGDGQSMGLVAMTIHVRDRKPDLVEGGILRQEMCQPFDDWPLYRVWRPFDIVQSRPSLRPEGLFPNNQKSHDYGAD